jgi:arginine decarboxylase
VPVVEDIVDFAASYDYGFEAGSKAELLIAISHCQPRSLIVCNGYKDRAYIETALLVKAGMRVVIVVEKMSGADDPRIAGG